MAGGRSIDRKFHDFAQPEKFMLRTTLTSPFGRKARMAADVLGLNDRVTVAHADVADENDTLRQQNPLGKIPCLVRADGTAVYDSGVILEFLQQVAGTDRLDARERTGPHPDAHEGAARRRHHRCGRLDHLRRSLSRAGRTVRALARASAREDRARACRVRIGTARCAQERRRRPSDSPVRSSFLDRRKAVEWRPTCPRLVEWLDAFAKNEPAFERMRAPGT